MFKFLKNIFGNVETTRSSFLHSDSTPTVPESVLDRFLLNAKELYYYNPNTDEIAFKLEGKKVSLVKDNPYGSVAVVGVFWLRTIYTSNPPLFESILKRFKSFGDTTNDDAKRKFLWAYFRTGNTTNQPQLSMFYERGKALVAFLDTISSNWKLMLNPNKHDISVLLDRIGDLASLKSVDGLTDEELTLIVIEFMSSINNNSTKTQSKPISNDVVTNEKFGDVEILEPKIYRAKVSRQQKINMQKTNTDEAYLLLFSASWCGPSKRFVKEIKEAGVNCYSYIDVDEDWTQDLAVKYQIRNVPTTILVSKDGAIINKWIGYDDEDPGQKKFVEYINTCKYRIIPFSRDTENVNVGKIMPEKRSSYAVDDNGEPMLVYLRTKSQVFVSRPVGNESVAYYLNIRKPLLIDVAEQSRIEIPSIPTGCDGIILENYGANNSKAFIVRDFDSQSMLIPLI